jgi:hypothetical protein
MRETESSLQQFGEFLRKRQSSYAAKCWDSNRTDSRSRPGPNADRTWPVVLSIPETASLLAAMRGVPKVMAGLIVSFRQACVARLSRSITRQR